MGDERDPDDIDEARLAWATYADEEHDERPAPRRVVTRERKSDGPLFERRVAR